MKKIIGFLLLTLLSVGGAFGQQDEAFSDVSRGPRVQEDSASFDEGDSQSENYAYLYQSRTWSSSCSVETGECQATKAEIEISARALVPSYDEISCGNIGYGQVPQFGQLIWSGAAVSCVTYSAGPGYPQPDGLDWDDIKVYQPEDPGQYTFFLQVPTTQSPQNILTFILPTWVDPYLVRNSTFFIHPEGPVPAGLCWGDDALNLKMTVSGSIVLLSNSDDARLTNEEFLTFSGDFVSDGSLSGYAGYAQFTFDVSDREGLAGQVRKFELWLEGDDGKSHDLSYSIKFPPVCLPVSLQGVFANGFESGDASAWSTAVGLVAPASDVI